jgi:hypothetical protein
VGSKPRRGKLESREQGVTIRYRLDLDCSGAILAAMKST